LKNNSDLKSLIFNLANSVECLQTGGTGTGGTKGSKGKTIRSYNDQAVRQGKDNVKGYGAYVERSYEESSQLSD